jgi:hypothetical protein
MERLGAEGQWKGRALFDRYGDKVGTIEAVYFGPETQRPRWARIGTGLFGLGGQSMVPLANAQPTGDGVLVPYTKDHIKDAPKVSEDLTPDEDTRLCQHYGLPARVEPSAFAPGPAEAAPLPVPPPTSPTHAPVIPPAPADWSPSAQPPAPPGDWSSPQAPPPWEAAPSPRPDDRSWLDAGAEQGAAPPAAGAWPDEDARAGEPVAEAATTSMEERPEASAAGVESAPWTPPAAPPPTAPGEPVAERSPAPIEPEAALAAQAGVAADATPTPAPAAASATPGAPAEAPPLGEFARQLAEYGQQLAEYGQQLARYGRQLADYGRRLPAEAERDPGTR